jgi:hypothetical protein
LFGNTLNSSLCIIRCLKPLDSKFTDGMGLNAKKQTVKFIADLYREGFGKISVSPQPKKKKLRKNPEACDTSGEQENADDFLATVYNQLKEKQVMDESNKDGDNSDGEETEGMKEARFVTMIEAELEDYMFYCSQTNWADLCEQFPTAKYSSGEPINYDLIMKTKDPQYTAALFDVLAWYKLVGKPRFGHIATAAAIRLGKPTHNAFLERAFSWGTYHDDILRKRLKADKFEMSVLDSLNSGKCDSLLEEMNKGVQEKRDDDNDQYVNKFFEKSPSTEEVLTNLGTID